MSIITEIINKRIHQHEQHRELVDDISDEETERIDYAISALKQIIQDIETIEKLGLI